MSEFHAEAPQATVSQGLAQGPYVAARAGFEPATLRTRVDESTSEPPRSNIQHDVIISSLVPQKCDLLWIKGIKLFHDVAFFNDKDLYTQDWKLNV